MGFPANTLSRVYTKYTKHPKTLNFKRKAVQAQLWPNNSTIALSRTVLFSGTIVAVTGIWILQFTPCKAFGGNYNYTYSISPALPSGITINSRTGVVSGMSTTATANTTYTVTVTSGASTVTSTFILGVTSLYTVNADVLVVGGGGGGASNQNAFAGAGGGGAGGYYYATHTLSFPDNTQASGYLITVGAGGAGGINQDSGFRGSPSSIYKLNNLDISRAGGGGGVWSTLSDERNGASGGGAPAGQFGWWGTSAGSDKIGYGIYPGSPYIDAPRQGYNGGIGGNGSNWAGAGGGGGSTGLGGDYFGASGNIGGPGTTCSDVNISAATNTGYSNAYAGGGGGGQAGGNGQGEGGNGAAGGGRGGSSNTLEVRTALPRTGSGGGGGGSANYGYAQGGAGGSGVVIVSYPGGQTLNGGTVYSYSGKTYHVFTTSGQYLTRL